jgi:hypothetical protein
MPASDYEYVFQTSSRIVRMFEMYARNINPEEERFQAFISKYIADKGITNIRAVPYVQLYTLIKEGIREYLRIQEPAARQSK